METNRQRLEKRGEMDNSTLTHIFYNLGDRLCGYCRGLRLKEHGELCEGRWCDEAFEEWLENEADEEG